MADFSTVEHRLITITSGKGVAREHAVPATGWVGYRGGVIVAWYGTRGMGDRAIERRQVEATAPAERLGRPAPAPQAMYAGSPR
jgi:hypothetical protein